MLGKYLLNYSDSILELIHYINSNNINSNVINKTLAELILILINLIDYYLFFLV